MLLRVKTFEKDFNLLVFFFAPQLLHTRHPPSAHSPSLFFISYYISQLVTAKQTLSLSSAVQTKQCTDVRSQICTMTPFQGATVGTLKTITPLSSLRGVITESDAPAEFVEIRVVVGVGVGGLQFYCLLRKVGKQKTSIKEGFGINDVRAAVRLSDEGSVGQLWSVKQQQQENDITAASASHNLSQNFQLSPGKLYCRLIKILEVGGLAIQKRDSLRNETYGARPVQENVCRMNPSPDYYHRHGE